MITIEGKTYDRRPQEKRKPLNPRVAQLMMMASMFSMDGYPKSSKPRGYVYLDAAQLIKEYELIQHLSQIINYYFNQSIITKL